jgi:hypothetical protein
LFVSLRQREGESPREVTQRELITLLAIWFIAAYVFFSAITTKFHHYIYSAVPAASILIGVVLDRMLGGARLSGAMLTAAAVGSCAHCSTRLQWSTCRPNRIQSSRCWYRPRPYATLKLVAGWKGRPPHPI